MLVAVTGEGVTQADLRLQLLGLAFAGADVLFDIDAAGKLGLCLGAVEQLTGRRAADLAGRDWLELFSPDDRLLLKASRAGLSAGARLGPLRVKLSGPRGPDLTTSLSLFRLPQRPGWTSCALTLSRSSTLDTLERQADGLIEAEAFAEAADQIIREASSTGAPVHLDLIELPGMAAGVSGLSDEEAADARRKVAATLRAQSFGGMAASELAPDRYAVIRTQALDAEAFGSELKATSGLDLSPELHALMLDGPGISEHILVVRHAIDRFASASNVGEIDFATLFAETRNEAAQFRTRLATGDFALHYQPVVDLASRQLHHFEALVRFREGASPAPMLQLAEDLDIITDFDLAVFGMVAKLTNTSSASIAVNVSARSIIRPAFRAGLLALTAGCKSVRRRLLLELTETHALTDLKEAAEGIEELREAGHAICLDDFGAGASSINYIRRLPLDYVKIDGLYVREVESETRDHVLLKHIVRLCHDLKLPVIAESVETAETAELLRGLKVDFAQGWFFGRPTPRPVWTPKRAG